MKRGQLPGRKAVLVSLSICLVFGVAGWLGRSSPYDFQVISVVQEPHRNMRVKLKFTNRSNEPLELWTVENGIQSVGYIPANQGIPNSKPLRAFSFSGVIRSGKKTVQRGEELIIEDEESIRNSGDEFIAVWQPPASGWFLELRRGLEYKVFGLPEINLSAMAAPPKTMKEKLRNWISPDPPRLLVSEKFVVP